MQPSFKSLANSHAAKDAQAVSLEERLERCEIVYFSEAPFAIPEGDDRQFLLEQQLAHRAHKNISFDPHTHKAAGFRKSSAAESERVRSLLESFSQNATAWLSKALPRYSAGWQLDRVSYRPAEEATRQLRLKARNDLLHVDSFPTRPTNGNRILRLFVNLNPTEVRKWVTSDPFGTLLAKYGHEVGLPGQSQTAWNQRIHSLQEGFLRLFQPDRPVRSPYDAFMLKFHDYLKANSEFQKHGPKNYRDFPPGSAWIVFTDAVSHAVLRGRFALEHSYFVSPEVLVLPEESPLAHLERASGIPSLRKAA